MQKRLRVFPPSDLNELKSQFLPTDEASWHPANKELNNVIHTMEESEWGTRTNEIASYGRYLAIINTNPNASPYFSLIAPSPVDHNKEEMKQALSSFFDFIKPRLDLNGYVTSITHDSSVQTQFVEVLKEKGIEFSISHFTNYVMSKKQAEDFQSFMDTAVMDLQCGFEVVSSPEDISRYYEQIHENWSFSYTEQAESIKDRLQRFPAVGIREISSGKLVAWMMCYHWALELSNLFVLPEYRSRKFGEIVTNLLIAEMLKKGFRMSISIEDTNTGGIRYYSKYPFVSPLMEVDGTPVRSTFFMITKAK